MSFYSVSPTEGQRRAALALIVATVAAFGAIAPFALTPLPRSDGYIPTVQAIIAATDLVTAVLLFAQFVAVQSRALLVLAGGYLFAAVVVAAHTLTFPGAFSPTGLFGAGTQTAAWLYVAWHAGFPLAVIGYVLAKRLDATEASLPVPAALGWTAIISVGLGVAISWAAVAFHDFLPILVISETAFSAPTNFVTALILLISVVALAMLSFRRASVLDWWLTVAVCGAVAESALVTFVAASRYTLAFYSGRLFGIVVSTAVLAALLWEMMRLYARLAFAVRALQRERAAKLLKLEVMLGAVAHEIKQPLTAIGIHADAARHLLKQPSTDIDGARESVEDIKTASHRVGAVLDNIRALVKDAEQERKPIDPKELVFASLEHLREEIENHNIVVSLRLARELPPVIGHAGQLQEVLLNILQNAIESMTAVTDRPRTLRIETADRDIGRIRITVADSGCGIEPRRLDSLFDSYVSTKPHGMGLGLGICRMIVDRHGGEISASSEVGRGSRFDVTLPIDRTLPAEPNPLGRSQSTILKSTPYMRGSAYETREDTFVSTASSK